MGTKSGETTKKDEKKGDGVDKVDGVDPVAVGDGVLVSTPVLVAEYDRYFAAALGGMVARFGPGNPGVMMKEVHEIALWGLKTREHRLGDMGARVEQWKLEE